MIFCAFYPYAEGAQRANVPMPDLSEQDGTLENIGKWDFLVANKTCNYQTNSGKVSFTDESAFKHTCSLVLVTLVKNEKDAKKKLENDEILGIYYIKEIPSLTITRNGVSQSILTSLLNTYNQNAHLFKVIARTHPERLSDAVASLQTNGSFITEKSVGGKTLNPTVLYFFALIAYACMSGAYLSIEAVRDTQANLSPLGARRSITPYRKQFLIFIDMLVLIFIHFINVMILTFYVNYILDIDLGNNYLAILATNFMGSLIGICLGLMIGCIGKLTFSAKIGICTSTTLLTGFFVWSDVWQYERCNRTECPHSEPYQSGGCFK